MSGRRHWICVQGKRRPRGDPVTQTQDRPTAPSRTRDSNEVCLGYGLAVGPALIFAFAGVFAFSSPAPTLTFAGVSPFACMLFLLALCCLLAGVVFRGFVTAPAINTFFGFVTFSCPPIVKKTPQDLPILAVKFP